MATSLPSSPILSASGVLEAKRVGGALNILFDLDRINRQDREKMRLEESKKLIDTMDSLLKKNNG